MHCLFRLVSEYLSNVLDYLDVSLTAISTIHFLLVVMDFYVSEWLYDNMVFEFFSRNEKILHTIFKQVRKIFENTIYSWLEGVKDIVFALLAGIIPKLPSAIRTPLEFLGLTKFLDKSFDKYKSSEDKNRKEQEYLEYARKIEQNRPGSPTKINRPGSPTKNNKFSFDEKPTTKV